jgi:hypothetical protein
MAGMGRAVAGMGQPPHRALPEPFPVGGDPGPVPGAPQGPLGDAVGAGGLDDVRCAGLAVRVGQVGGQPLGGLVAVAAVLVGLVAQQFPRAPPGGAKPAHGDAAARRVLDKLVGDRGRFG